MLQRSTASRNERRDNAAHIRSLSLPLHAVAGAAGLPYTMLLVLRYLYMFSCHCLLVTLKSFCVFRCSLPHPSGKFPYNKVSTEAYSPELFESYAKFKAQAASICNSMSSQNQDDNDWHDRHVNAQFEDSSYVNVICRNFKLDIPESSPSGLHTATVEQLVKCFEKNQQHVKNMLDSVLRCQTGNVSKAIEDYTRKITKYAGQLNEVELAAVQVCAFSRSKAVAREVRQMVLPPTLSPTLTLVLSLLSRTHLSSDDPIRV